MANIAVKRAQLAELLLARALDAVKLMKAPYEEYVGVNGKKVVYAGPPAGSYRNYALAAQILLNSFRLEMGESTAKTETNIRAQVDTIARAEGLDPDEVMAEARRILEKS